MRILVTGGGGMVGSALVRRLQSDHHVMSPSRKHLDLMDRVNVERILRESNVDIVVHAAGRVGGIAANAAANAAFLLDNAYMGLNVLEGARLAGISKVLNLGSSCIYPADRVNALREEDVLTGPLEPTNEGYAMAKITVLKFAAMLQSDHEACDYKTAIPCNLYGPGDHYEAARSHMLPSAVRKVLHAKAQGLDEVEIWGDGTARREFMFVDDLARFVAAAIDGWDTLPSIVNVGLGYDYSVNDYYQAVARAADWDGRFTHDTNRLVGMQRKLLDISRLSEWGWKAPTSLDGGLRLTINDYLERFS